MSINIRYPNITASSEKEQLSQVKSYLHQLVDQLNYALPTIGTGEKQTESTQSASTKTYEVQGGEVSYYELRSLIVQELQKVEDLIDEIERARDNGEFDGVGIASTDITDEGMIVSYTDGSKTNLGKLSITMDEEGNLYYEVIQGENIDNEEVE